MGKISDEGYKSSFYLKRSTVGSDFVIELKGQEDLDWLVATAKETINEISKSLKEERT